MKKKDSLAWQDSVVCPEDKGELLHLKEEDILYNPRLKRKYLIKDGIPIMLIDEAVNVDEAEHKQIIKQQK